MTGFLPFSIASSGAAPQVATDAAFPSQTGTSQTGAAGAFAAVLAGLSGTANGDAAPKTEGADAPAGAIVLPETAMKGLPTDTSGAGSALMRLKLAFAGNPNAATLPGGNILGGLGLNTGMASSVALLAAAPVSSSTSAPVSAEAAAAASAGKVTAVPGVAASEQDAEAEAGKTEAGQSEAGGAETVARPVTADAADALDTPEAASDKTRGHDPQTPEAPALPQQASVQPQAPAPQVAPALTVAVQGNDITDSAATDGAGISELSTGSDAPVALTEAAVPEAAHETAAQPVSVATIGVATIGVAMTGAAMTGAAGADRAAAPSPQNSASQTPATQTSHSAAPVDAATLAAIAPAAGKPSAPAHDAAAPVVTANAGTDVALPADAAIAAEAALSGAPMTTATGPEAERAAPQQAEDLVARVPDAAIALGGLKAEGVKAGEAKAIETGAGEVKTAEAGAADPAIRGRDGLNPAEPLRGDKTDAKAAETATRSADASDYRSAQAQAEARVGQFAARPAEAPAAQPVTATPVDTAAQALNGQTTPLQVQVTHHGSQAGHPHGADVVKVASPHQLPEAVGVAISRHVGDEATQFTLRLDPAELGRIEVKLEMGKDGQASVSIQADNASTFDLLRRDSSALERALAEAGLKLDSGGLNFSLRQQDGQNQQQQFAGDASQRQATGRMQEGGLAALEQDNTPRPSRRNGAAGLLDLSI